MLLTEREPPGFSQGRRSIGTAQSAAAEVAERGTIRGLRVRVGLKGPG